MEIEEWPEEWRRGVLSFAVLSVLSRADSYGYEIIEMLDGGGFGRFKGGTIYPLLQRLEEQALLEHYWVHPTSGPARKTLRLTRSGQAFQERLSAAWGPFTLTVKNLESTP